MSLIGRFHEITREYIGKWYSLSEEDFKDIRRYSLEEKLINEKAISYLLDSTFIKLKEFPKEEKEREIWGKEFNKNLGNAVKDINIISPQIMDYISYKGIIRSTKEFFKKAIECEEELSIEEIGQAMRNFCIMGTIQLILQKKVKLTSSAYAYSMLYPYTDNYLDNSLLSFNKKMEISKRFHKRLGGGDIKPNNAYEDKIFSFVEYIEKQYKREEYEEVFQSLLIIHEAQVRSLIQQQGVCPFEKDVLSISFHKGGASVLADGYLAAGKLSENEIRFLLGYGIMLQLGDDIQDIKSDKLSQSATMFSLLAGNWGLEGVTNKLFRFINNIVHIDLESISFENKEEIKNFIEENCNLLVLIAIFKNKKYYTRNYMKSIEVYLPFRPKFLKTMSKKIRKQCKGLKKGFNKDMLRDINKYI